MDGPPRICVVIPVFNHGLTVGRVARGAKAHCPVLVVNDGSTDDTPTVLSAETGITVVTLPNNQGKAAALRAGFVRAEELGFTHAITIDADGQHSTDAVPEFIAACRRQPEAFLIGEHGKSLLGCSARHVFANISRSIGLREATEHRRNGHGPRLQDFRHSFATGRLVEWYRAGLDVARELPKLATYLGHVDVALTYWYIEAVPELLQLAANYLGEKPAGERP